MEQNIKYITHRLSLRQPQEDSLKILAEITSMLPLSKQNNLQQEMADIKAKYPAFKDFERNFPNICFALATGVGKTRLMGAFMAYLYKEHNITDFCVLAPNLTVYRKLISDFSQIGSEKYVFKGIADFTATPPLIVTGDTYREKTDGQLFAQSIRIHVFNISKLDKTEKDNSVPLIKRLSECLGQSYFDYLSSIKQLVLIMDESHHYRSERAMQVIAELNPALGIELTATPQTQQGGRKIPFKNVVFDYPLAKALHDGFAKKPYVATRKNWNPSDYKEDEIDRIKVQDGIRLHQDTRVELEKYARNNNIRIVRPFVLIVTKDINHAENIKKMIDGEDFYGGYYKDKTIVIHSNQRGKEKDENISQLLALELPINKIEIVIHVNSLKEGWDVKNLYTIVPLRASASETLTEQTIGRGLRLPYGKITGDEAADRLTIVAHDKFQDIIDEANRQGSIIRKENIIELDSDYESTWQQKEIIVSNPVYASNNENKSSGYTEQCWLPENEKEEEAFSFLCDSVLPDLGRKIKTIGDLSNEEIRQEAMVQVKNHLAANSLFAEEEAKKIDVNYSQIVQQFKNCIIPIPRIVIQPGRAGRLIFKPFTLDVSSISYQPVSEEIFIKSLTDGKYSFLGGKAHGEINTQTPEEIILSALFDVPEISYDDYSEMLYGFAKTVADKLRSYIDDDKSVKNVAIVYRRQIADLIFSQMKQHSEYEKASYLEAKVYPFERIYPHNYEKITSDKLYLYTETVDPISDVPKKVFTGFTKSCHTLYKFDSNPEKGFSKILELDREVIKWLRPNQKQFQIYWGDGNSLYEPDFVIETEKGFYIAEIKSAADLQDKDVQEKAKAAMTWIEHVNRYSQENGLKKWSYLLIPHTEVQDNKTFSYFLKFAQKNN